ncbi:MAG: ABC transporter ATP-binding protein [Bacteriovoracaceae bacterium]|nr:ABC transporter ATP-binding protein [Bacteriovoracaceae bacterium]
MSNKLLEIKNLSIEFNSSEGVVKAVDNISFSIDQGQTVGLVGESGSGKSVTALALMRLIPNPPGRITSGEILFEGRDILKISENEMRKIRGNDISMIFQEPMTSLNPVFRVGEQIVEVLMLHQKLAYKQAWAKAIDLLDQVGIPNPSQKILSYPHEMSGGQKQRVMIAMAIACEPKLLIADEPTTALDVTIQKQVLELMFKLQEKYKMGMLFITHDLGVVADIADDMVVMYRSKIVEQNHKNEIFKNPQHPYSKGLLACRPSLAGNPKKLLTVSDFMTETGAEKKVDKHLLKIHQKDYTFSEKENPILLEVENLKTYFPIKGGVMGRVVNHVKAVDGVSFTLRKGKTLGLVGESGCGKTTLGRTILRLIEPTEGVIKYAGQDVTKMNQNELRQLRSKIQIIFQDPYSSLNPRMTIGEALLEPMIIHNVGRDKKDRMDRAKWLLNRVGLNANQLNRYPHEFSGGQRQRISIARALTLNPEFIICDESVSALDVSVQAQVLNLLLELQEEYNLTYIFISHDLGVVSFISDQVGVMNDGKIVEFNNADNVYRNPQNDYTKTLLSAIPKGLPAIQL